MRDEELMTLAPDELDELIERLSTQAKLCKRAIRSLKQLQDKGRSVIAFTNHEWEEETILQTVYSQKKHYRRKPRHQSLRNDMKRILH